MPASPLASAMRPNGRLFACAAALVWLLTPGASAAPGTGTPKLPEDARLAKAVTLKLRKTPLSEVAAALSRETGVTVRTAEMVADEPAVVWVKDQPARELMRQLAELFDYRWKVSGAPGHYRYELYQDVKGKRQEELLREQERRKLLESIHLKLQKAAEQLREHPNPRQEADLLAASLLAPAHWGALASGRTLHFSSNPQPGALPLAARLAGRLIELQRLGEEEAGAMPPEGVSVRLWLTFDTNNVSLSVRRDLHRGATSSIAGGVLASAYPSFPRDAPEDPARAAIAQQDALLKLVRPFAADIRKIAPGRRPDRTGVTFLHLRDTAGDRGDVRRQPGGRRLLDPDDRASAARSPRGAVAVPGLAELRRWFR